MFRTHLVDGAGLFIRHREQGSHAVVVAALRDGEWVLSGVGDAELRFRDWMNFRFLGVLIKFRFRQMTFMKRASLEVKVDAPQIIEISPLCRPFRRGVDKGG